MGLRVSNLSPQKADFRRRAIESCFYFFSKKLAIKPSDIAVTVFRGDKDAPLDEESIRIWRELGITDDKIRMGGREENWSGPASETGPCGPTTEIYVDDLKVWSIAFNEYSKNTDGQYLKQNL